MQPPIELILFLEKYHGRTDVIVAFGEDDVVALKRETYEEIEKLPCPMAGAIAMQLLTQMVKPNFHTEGGDHAHDQI